MFFSLQTVALIASSGLFAQSVSGATIEERATSLCNQANYGAKGYPWKSNSTPGSFCSKTKPSNSKAWAQIPFWDGGDNVRCSTSQRNNYNVCKGGNKKTSLPKNCNPPHKHSKGTTSSAGKTSTSATNKAAVSSTAASSVAVTTTTTGTTDFVPVSSTFTSVAAASSTAAVVDPLSDPVCELTYQVQYSNYTLVAANGVWAGLTVGAATQDASYMTYTLATSVDDCLAACDQIEGCVFVNTYYDVNEEENYLPKHADGVLTCSMYSTCVGTEKNDNWGGQDDPNTIVNSNGYCKSGACSS
ncbi:hypothetical protein B9479_005678 [Cryptococcus floricola]|uniref:Apple domain-containing protein n=1 Tax=Cryptococcus floricola TaxID=2591691 RepID=A0A5D3AU21_9TREE|nr:hypothetical protein B9479_005678 [Cryptococcus floricola]